MRPVTTSTGTEALQNSLVRRYGVGRCLCWSCGGEACHTETEVSMTEELHQSAGERLGVSKLGSQCLYCTASHRCLCIYAEGWGREVVQARSFVAREMSL